MGISGGTTTIGVANAGPWNYGAIFYENNGGYWKLTQNNVSSGSAGAVSGGTVGGATVVFTGSGGPITTGTVSLAGSSSMATSGGTAFILASGTLDPGNLFSSAGTVQLGTSNYQGTLTLPGVQYVLGGSYGTASVWGYAGSGSTGSLTLPALTSVLTTAPVFGIAGTASSGLYLPVQPAYVYSGQSYGASGGSVGTLTLTAGTNVIVGTGQFGLNGSSVTPLYVPVTQPYVLNSQSFGPSNTYTGTLTLPTTGSVLNGLAFGVSGTASTGTFWVPSTSGTGSSTLDNNAVKWGVRYGPSGSNTGAYSGHGPLEKAGSREQGAGSKDSPLQASRSKLPPFRSKLPAPRSKLFLKEDRHVLRLGR